MKNKEKNKKYIWFIIFALIALMIVFAITNSFEDHLFQIRSNDLISNETKDKNIVLNDPFVTKADDFYKSFIKPHNLIMENGDMPVIVFCDFTQESCADLWQDLKEIKDKNLSITLAWKHFPISTNPISQSVSRAVICAKEQDAFWGFTELIFKENNNLKESDFSKYIDQLGLDIQKFETCFNNENIVELVGKDMEDTQNLRVNNFPYAIVGSVRLDKDNIKLLTETIQRELNQ